MDQGGEPGLYTGRRRTRHWCRYQHSNITGVFRFEAERYILR